MPRFKPYDYRQSLLVPLTLEEQLPAGSLEYALHHLIEERIEESWFEDLYANEEMGRPAYSPKLLLKVILLGYARGLLSSRRLERACKENVTFMAISCGLRPDHSTLAAFVDKLQGRIEVIFSEVLLVCHEEGLLSGTHLSLDGLKLPGNASREWSGTFQELRLKAAKLQRKLAEKLAEHRRQDRLDRSARRAMTARARKPPGKLPCSGCGRRRSGSAPFSKRPSQRRARVGMKCKAMSPTTNPPRCRPATAWCRVTTRRRWSMSSIKSSSTAGRAARGRITGRSGRCSQEPRRSWP